MNEYRLFRNDCGRLIHKGGLSLQTFAADGGAIVFLLGRVLLVLGRSEGICQRGLFVYVDGHVVLRRGAFAWRNALHVRLRLLDVRFGHQQRKLRAFRFVLATFLVFSLLIFAPEIENQQNLNFRRKLWT